MIISETMKYVVLESLEYRSRFYSPNLNSSDPTLSGTGETWYRVLGYANTGDEARDIISTAT